MTEQASEYTMGYSEDFLRMLHRRSAQTHAAYLLPHLEPGMRLLDFGCGPGTISVGLAKAIGPGELHGVDLEESQILMARAAAKAGGHANATFHISDVTALPFEDDSFDVAHCHTVLTHIPDTQAVLAEVRRVLKPGGMIASREMIGSSSFMAPDFDNSGAWATFVRLIAANGGHPDMGKQLKGVLSEAGFADIRASASFDFFGTSEDVAFFHAVATGWFFSDDVMEAATKYGLATREDFAAWRAAADQWRDHAGSIGAVGFGEAMASKP